MNLEQSILVIDDDPDDFEILHSCLMQVGFRGQVFFAASGKEAVGFLQSREEDLPSLIVLDLNMPIMGGLEVLTKIKMLYNAPVVIHTTLCSDETMKQLKALGALDCRQKGRSYSDYLKFANHILKWLSKLT